MATVTATVGAGLAGITDDIGKIFLLYQVKEMDITDLIEKIFSKPPEPPCTYNLIPTGSSHDEDLDDGDDDNLFPILINVLVGGAKKLYGPNVSPEKISEEQFLILNAYMSSLGFNIEYEYEYGSGSDGSDSDDDRDPIAINIWFSDYEL